MPRLPLLTALLASSLVLAACSDSDDGGSEAPPPQPVAAQPADFPAADGGTLEELTRGKREGPILLPAVSALRKDKKNRFAFVIVDRAQKQIDVSAIAVYTAKPDGTGVRGPFVARKESLAVATEHRSELTAADLARGKTFYVAEVPFSEPGQHQVMGLARLDGRLVMADAPQILQVGRRDGPPKVGDKAIRIHTETAADVGGDLERISTRVPPPEEMLDVDFADVVGKEPVVLLFATPQLCSSRTCGPVVDIAEQVRARSGEGVTFIQQEIYNDNQVDKGYREQVTKWRLPTEPWAFVIDRRGRVSDRFEGVFSAGELARAVAKVK